MRWDDHPIWNDPELKGRCFDLIYTFLFRPKSAMPKRPDSSKQEPFEASVYEAVCEASNIWGRGIFIADRDDYSDDGISRELVKTTYTAGIRKLLYGEIKKTGDTRQFGTEGIDAFLLYCLKNSDPLSQKYQRINDRFDLWSLIPILSSESYPDNLSRDIHDAIANKRHNSVVGLMSSYFNVTEEETASAASHVTKFKTRLDRVATDDDRGFFYCYRFSEIPGRVVKTFHVFTPADAEYPYTRFQNFFGTKQNAKRVSDGIVFELSGYICGLGRVGNPGSMLKILVLQKPDEDGNIGGITLTSSNDGKSVIASRVLLKKAAPGVFRHDKAGTGMIPVEQLVATKELTLSDVKRIRNRIHYTLGGKVKSAETDDVIPNLGALIQAHKDRCVGGLYLRTGLDGVDEGEVDFLNPKFIPFDGVLGEFNDHEDGH